MKKYLVLFFLLASLTSFGQFSNYTNINGRYKWIAGKFDSTFTLPSGTTPSLRTGGGTGPGALFYRTTDSTVYQYTGTQWIKLRAGVSPTDTAGIWLTNVYRKPGSDSVFYVKGGSSTFAFRDSVGNVGGGGGGGKIYYFNGGVNMGTFGGLTMYELGDTAVTGSAANFTRATTGAIANFITDVNKPGLLQIPAGVWTIDAYVSETGGGANHAQIWAVLEKWNGSTITTIATSPIEEITNGSVIDLYTWTISVPTTSISVTDRIIIQFYITNTNGKTVTLYTQNGYVGEVHTTFTTGIGSLNGLTAPSQFFATGTSGTDFNIASATATHTFNLPTASATNRGALSSADWTTFNSKVGGSGTTNYLSKWTSSSALGNSLVFDNGTSVGVNTATPNASFSLDINGNARANKLAVNRTSFVGSNVFQVDGISTFSGDTYVVSNASSNNVLTIFSNSLAATFFNIISNGNGAYFNNTTGWDIRQSGLPLVGFSSTLLNFYTSGTEKMRLTNAGRLLIGTTTESTYELDVVGDIRSTLDANINGLTVGRGGGSVSENTAFGVQAINGTPTGTWATANGYFALKSLTTGNGNTAIGAYAGEKTTTGGNNTFLGVFAGQYNTTASANVAIGTYAGYGVNGRDNTLVGVESGYNLSTGVENTYIGRSSGRASTTAQSNVFIGFQSGFDVTTANNNSFVGRNTGRGITTGSNNTIIGAEVTGLSASLSNTIILADGQGNQRLYINSSGNVGLGGGTADATYKMTVGGIFQFVTGSSFFGMSSGNLTLNNWGAYINNQSTSFSFLGQIAGANIGSFTGSSTAVTINSITNLPLRFLTNNTEVGRFFANGNFAIGTTTDAGYKLDVNGTARVQGNMTLGSTTLPTLWANINALRFGQSGIIAGVTNSNDASFSNNVLFDGTNTRRIVSGFANSIGFGNNGDFYLTQYAYALGNAIITSADTRAVINSYYGTGIVFNENGANDIDFRVEGDTDANLFFTKASTDRVGIGNNSPSYKFDITGDLRATTSAYFATSSGAVGIGTTSPNASALLDVSSTTKGFLPPRMTNAQMVAIATPAAGLVVYDTTNNKLNVYDGTNWVTLH